MFPLFGAESGDVVGKFLAMHIPSVHRFVDIKCRLDQRHDKTATSPSIATSAWEETAGRERRVSCARFDWC
jgi:hypothetical protein